MRRTPRRVPMRFRFLIVLALLTLAVELPQHVRDLIAESEREHGNLTPTCELVRAVAIEGW